MNSTTRNTMLHLMALIRDMNEFHTFQSRRQEIEWTASGYEYEFGRVKIFESTSDLMPYEVLRTDGSREGFPNLLAAEIDAYAHLVHAKDLKADDPATIDLYMRGRSDSKSWREECNFNPLNYQQDTTFQRRLHDAFCELTNYLIDATEEDGSNFEDFPEVDNARSIIGGMTGGASPVAYFNDKCPCCESRELDETASVFSCRTCQASWSTRPVIDLLSIGNHLLYPRKERSKASETAA